MIDARWRWTRAGAAGLWAAWLCGAPLWPGPVAGLAYAVGSCICHQLASRSLHLAGAQMAVCARCAGIYLALAVGLVALAAWPRVGAVAMRGTARVVLIAGAVPMAISVAIEGIGMWDPGNGVRGMTGAIAGVALAGVLVRAAATVDYQRA